MNWMHRAWRLEIREQDKNSIIPKGGGGGEGGGHILSNLTLRH